MPDALNKKEMIHQCLIDSGCGENEIQICMSLLQQGEIQKLRDQLSAYKKCLMNEIHKKQKEVDCVDYLIHSLGKEQI